MGSVSRRTVRVVLIGPIYSAALVLLALFPIRRPWALGMATAAITIFPLELPFHFVLVVALSNWTTIANLDPATPAGVVRMLLSSIIVIGMGVVVRQSSRAGVVLETALGDGLGADWRNGIAAPPFRHGRRRPWVRMLLAPWPLRPHNVERTKNIAYGPDRRYNRLDLYRQRSAHAPQGVLIHLHPGGFRWGSKSSQSRSLLFHMARHGWATISADYHLTKRPVDGFPDHLVDVKRVIAWTRTEGNVHGIAAGAPVVLVGGSAGAHLATMAALTVNDAAFQPGFADLDTSVTAAVGLYGYYGELGGSHPVMTSPIASVRNEHIVSAVHGFAEWARQTSKPTPRSIRPEPLRSSLRTRSWPWLVLLRSR